MWRASYAPANYDVVYNLHGGTTATFLTRATGARHRVGFKTYQYAQLHNHQAPSPLLLWGQQKTHSVEQQLALLGWTGVPVTDRPRTQLGISPEASETVNELLVESGLSDRKIALIHPAAAFATKQWATEHFARVAEFLSERGFAPVAIAAPNERALLDKLCAETAVKITTFDLSLPEVTALAAQSQLFVGNDSGIAHIAAAVGTPAVVIFGSSNIAHWRPWNSAPAEVVFEEMPCQPCHGYFCEKFDQPECILRVPVTRVISYAHRSTCLGCNMSQLTKTRAAEILKALQDRYVLVLGDVMLDEFVWGDVTRISPEAPVPVVDVRRESVHLGGAANVLANLVALGARGSVVGVVGKDGPGERLQTELRELGSAGRLLDR